MWKHCCRLVGETTPTVPCLPSHPWQCLGPRCHWSLSPPSGHVHLSPLFHLWGQCLQGQQTDPVVSGTSTTLWWHNGKGTAAITSCGDLQPLLHSGPFCLLGGSHTAPCPTALHHRWGGDRDSIQQPWDALCQRQGDTDFEFPQSVYRHRAQCQLTLSFPEGRCLSSAPLPKSPDACTQPGERQSGSAQELRRSPPRLHLLCAHLGVILLLTMVLGRPRIPSQPQVSNHTLQDIVPLGTEAHRVLPALPPRPQNRGGSHQPCAAGC